MNILQTIKKHNLINSGQTVGIGVSGGADSMALLDFLFCAKDSLGIKIKVYHIDHMIRTESQDDAELVGRYCKQNSIWFEVCKIDVPSLCVSQKKGVEQCARDQRLRFFNSKIGTEVDIIALAHHMQDQAETVLMHILRGSGLKGASGMAYKTGGIIRPLLDTTKAQILDYLSSRQIAYATDATNDDNNYTRNFLRNVVFPQIQKVYPQAQKNIVEFAKRAQTDDEFINSVVDGYSLTTDANSVQINASDFSGAAAVRLLARAAKVLGVYEDFGSQNVSDIESLAKGKSGSAVDLPHGITAYKDYQKITFTKNKVQATQDGSVPFVLGQTQFNGYKIIAQVSDTPQRFQANSGILYADFDKIDGAVWRNRQVGDTIKKFGGGTTTLKEFLIDKKVPSRQRDMPILAKGSQVFAVLGLEISEQVKVTKDTQKCVKIWSER